MSVLPSSSRDATQPPSSECGRIASPESERTSGPAVLQRQACESQPPPPPAMLVLPASYGYELSRHCTCMEMGRLGEVRVSDIVTSLTIGFDAAERGGVQRPARGSLRVRVTPVTTTGLSMENCLHAKPNERPAQAQLPPCDVHRLSDSGPRGTHSASALGHPSLLLL